MISSATTYSYAARNPAALRHAVPKLEIRSAAAVLGWTEADKAIFNRTRTANNLAAAERNFAGARAALGQANRARYGRRMAQAAAMRALNATRRQLREARAAAAAALTTALAFSA